MIALDEEDPRPVLDAHRRRDAWVVAHRDRGASQLVVDLLRLKAARALTAVRRRRTPLAKSVQFSTCNAAGAIAGGHARELLQNVIRCLSFPALIRELENAVLTRVSDFDGHAGSSIHDVADVHSFPCSRTTFPISSFIAAFRPFGDRMLANRCNPQSNSIRTAFAWQRVSRPDDIR
jgi:hypothetical protein